MSSPRPHEQLASYAPDEAAIAALFWTSGSFQTHLRTWLAEHGAEARRLLWGEEGEAQNEGGHLRLEAHGMLPEEIRDRRLSVPRELSARAIVAAFPGAYLSPPFRGFAYRDEAFRDWHIVTHTLSRETIAAAAQEAYDFDWFYGVTAQGQGQHTHALVSFRFAHPEAEVRRVLRLGAEPRLTPVHGDFKPAIRYLDNQALGHTEAGRRPRRGIWIDGNRIELPSRAAEMVAVGEGEATTVLRDHQWDRPERIALENWMRNARGDWAHRTRAQSNREAERTANAVARRYTNRVFTVALRNLLPGQVFTRPPPRWYGEEVVVIEDIPQALLERQLAAPWLASVPELIYTVTNDPARAAM